MFLAFPLVGLNHIRQLKKIVGYLDYPRILYLIGSVLVYKENYKINFDTSKALQHDMFDRELVHVSMVITVFHKHWNGFHCAVSTATVIN